MVPRHPEHQLDIIRGHIDEAYRLIGDLLHDQRVPLVEKTRLQRVQIELHGNQADLNCMRRRAKRPGWIVGQEGSSS